MKASYGEGFKPPSFFALGHPLVGNPNLRPERSRKFEVGLAHGIDAEGTAVQVSAFRTEIEDLVDFNVPQKKVLHRRE